MADASTSIEIGHSQRSWWGLSPIRFTGVTTVVTRAAVTAAAARAPRITVGRERRRHPNTMTAPSTAATTSNPRVAASPPATFPSATSTLVPSVTTPVATIVSLKPDRPHHGGSATTEATSRDPRRSPMVCPSLDVPAVARATRLPSPAIWSTSG